MYLLITVYSIYTLLYYKVSTATNMDLPLMIILLLSVVVCLYADDALIMLCVIMMMSSLLFSGVVCKVNI